MSRGPVGSGELEFLEAVMKQGFVNIPRILFTYTADLGLDYDIIGKMFIILASVGGRTDLAFGPYVISRKANGEDFEQLRSLVLDLEKSEIVVSEDTGDQVSFTFAPLFFHIRAIWSHYRDQHEEELARNGTTDPVLAAAERLLGRPLGSREITDIQDWMTSYGFDGRLVMAVVKEGKRSGSDRISYLNQIARGWHEAGVTTPEQAEEYIQQHRQAAGKHKSILQYLGLPRQINKAELSLLDKWTEEWGFSNEVVIRACEEATGSKNPLQYVNRVLERWMEMGLKTVADVDQAQAEYKRRPAIESAAAIDNRRRKTPAKSNVFLPSEKKDDNYYDHIYKKFGR
jgi:DnaD/phage-associated family protein